MATPAWQAGTYYVPDSIVRRTSTPAAVSATPTNAGFEDGDTGWTKDGGWDIVEKGEEDHTVHVFAGDWSAEFDATAVDAMLVNQGTFPVSVGQSITARCQVNQGYSSAGEAGARLELDWLDDEDEIVSTSHGNLVDSASNLNWKESTVTGIAPSGATKVRTAIRAFRTDDSNYALWVDSVSWDYVYSAPLESLVFVAVQADGAYSGATEPVWPTVAGETVVDGGVTWEAIDSSRVVWEASPILVSGDTEPAFPPDVGQTVSDGDTIVWTAVSRRIEDEKCPNTKSVTIGSSKVFAVDEDIIRYSTAVNPLDWSTTDDAGYIPFGLQTYGANPVAVLGLYRSNLVAFNSQGFQMWQIDPDPVNMAFLDAIPIGSTYAHTWVPVSDDMVGLTAVGVRSMSIAGASTNLQADSVGELIDPLVRAKVKALDSDDDPIGLFWPAMGQYWVIFPDAGEGTSEAFVLTINSSKKKSWSRYVFPAVIDSWTLDGNTLVLRAGTLIWEVDDDTLQDDFSAPAGEDPGSGVDFSGVIWWPYLDMDEIGREKGLVGLDLTCTAPEGVSVSIGYNQSNRALRTDDYEIDADTLPGQMIPFPVSGPSFDLRLTFAPGQAWEWEAANLYVQDWRLGA